MRAAIVERDVAALAACQDDAPIGDAEQFHLVHLQLVAPGGGDRITGGGRRLVLPFARLRVTMVDADEIARDQRAAHVSAEQQRDEADRFEREGNRAGTFARSAARQPGHGKQRDGAEVQCQVPRGARFSAARRGNGVDVVDEAGHRREQRREHSEAGKVSAHGAPRRCGEERARGVEQKRTGEECNRERDQHRVQRMAEQDRFALHVPRAAGSDVHSVHDQPVTECRERQDVQDESAVFAARDAALTAESVMVNLVLSRLLHIRLRPKQSTVRRTDQLRKLAPFLAFRLRHELTPVRRRHPEHQR